MPEDSEEQDRRNSTAHGTSAELLSQLQVGDDGAAEILFHRYLERLTRLARSRLSARLASRTDPEDVVLSAWRSFFVGARAGRYALQRSGDLWRLLASITMHKLYRQTRWHTAERRSILAEQSLDAVPFGSASLADREPSPEEALALADELQAVMQHLDDCGRRVLELRLQGEPLKNIAEITGRSERTVRRLVSRIRELLTRQLEDEPDD